MKNVETRDESTMEYAHACAWSAAAAAAAPKLADFCSAAESQQGLKGQ